MIERHSGISRIFDPYEQLAEMVVGGSLSDVAPGISGTWTHDSGVHLVIGPTGQVIMDASKGFPTSRDEVFRASLREGQLVGRTMPNPAAESAFANALAKLSAINQ